MHCRRQRLQARLVHQELLRGHHREGRHDLPPRLPAQEFDKVNINGVQVLLYVMVSGAAQTCYKQGYA